MTGVPGTKVAIRPVSKADYPMLSRLLEDNNLPQVTRYFHPFPLTAETAYRIACTDHLDRYYVAIVDGQFAGLCMLRGWDEGFEVPSLGILVDHRRRRLDVGRIMTRFAISEASRLECPVLRLTVHSSNRPAVRLYRSLGFREVDSSQAEVMGQPDTKIIMLKDTGDD